MSNISRRAFMGGVAASAVAAALPVPVLAGDVLTVDMILKAKETFAAASPSFNQYLAQIEWAQRAVDEMCGISDELLGAAGRDGIALLDNAAGRVVPAREIFADGR